jgi:hypothetical protein
MSSVALKTWTFPAKKAAHYNFVLDPAGGSVSLYEGQNNAICAGEQSHATSTQIFTATQIPTARHEKLVVGQLHRSLLVRRAQRDCYVPGGTVIAVGGLPAGS